MHDRPMTPEQRADLAQRLNRMQLASNSFYAQAVHCGVHGFIEFTGLMNEYIKVCQQSLEQGIDFSMANTHTGVQLTAHDYNLRYLEEKLDCIMAPFAEVVVQRRARPKAPVRGVLQDTPN